MMEKNLKKRKDAFNTSGSNRATPTSATSLASNALTKSADNRSRASSKTSLTSSLKSINRSEVDVNTGQDITKPDIITGYDLRAHLRQILTFSDDDEDQEENSEFLTSEDDYSIESFDESDDRDEELHRLANEETLEFQTRTPLPTGMNHVQSLVPIGEEDGEELDSEEENELMKEIRDEITNKVRQEMKSELELYQAKMQKLEDSAGSGEVNGEPESGGSGKVNTDLDDLDPKLKDAIIKMRKLDKILMKRVKREKEVKRDRILLERRIKKEIEELHKQKKDEYKEVLNNELKFLALELPPRHNEGVTIPDEFTGEEVFATQLNEDEYPGLHRRDKSRTAHSRSTHRSKGKKSKGDHQEGSEDEQSRGDASSVASGSTEARRHKKKNKKDFIKRNKELAADAQNLVAMTEEEKIRLDDLLKDVDSIPDIPVGAELDDTNPFQLAVRAGEGFVPDQEELRSLTSIDARLRELMPPDEFASIASSSLSHLPQHKLFIHIDVKHSIDWEHRGERVLFQNAEQRDLNERLRAIEEELAKLKNPEEIELETPRLDEDQLHDLIEQCVTSLSMTSMSRMTLNSESRTSFADTESVITQGMDSTVENTPRSPRSARQEILDHPPRLAPEVLQKLLSEAYHPLSKQLSTLKEVDNEDEENTPIPSEVWKLISMETVDESHTVDSLRESLSAQINNESVEFTPAQTVKSGQLSGNMSARNGFRTLSRNSSGSSLASVSELGTGRETREKEPLKLPDIDPTGTMITQSFTNQRRPGSNNSVRTPVPSVQASFSDSRADNMDASGSRLELLSLDGEIVSPHPPSRERGEGSGNKSRTIMSAGKGSVS